MGKASRDKGKVGEREMANILKAHGFDARRGVQYQGGPGSPDVVGLPGFHIEVKRTEKFSLYNALAQAKEDAIQDGGTPWDTPVVLHRQNGKTWVAVLDFEDFLELVKAARGEA